MWKLKLPGIKIPFVIGEKSDSGEPRKTGLDRAELDRRAFRNILLVALLGMLLVVADLILSWNSGDIEIVRDGKSKELYLLRPEDDRGHLSLRARVRTKRGVYEKDLDISMSPYLPEGEASPEVLPEDDSLGEEDRVMYELRSIISGLDRDTSLRKVLLPSTISGGGTIHWSRRKQSHSLMLLSMTLLLMVAVYRSRLLPLKKKQEQEKNSVMECLPSFVHQLVLLMNAGLTLNGAFEKVVEGNIRSRQEEDRFFYLGLRYIYASMERANGSLTEEFRDFAGNSGVAELMRIAALIRDNVDRGTELCKKLEKEAASLWMARKLHCEERGRLAETKMTLPLSIFLAVLILITVSPALIQL